MSLTLPDSSPYKFVAVSESRKCTVDLSFAIMNDATRDWLSVVWKNLCNAARRAHELTSQPSPKWVNWQPWKWCYERGLIDAGRTSVVAIADNCPVGFLTLWVTTDTQPLLYIEHIGVTPGDITTPIWVRRYTKVGWSLMAYAIHISRENGLGGRVGLHAADDVVLNRVYREYAKAVPGLFKTETKGIAGPTPYGPVKNLDLTYLETAEAQAEQFLKGFQYD